MKTINKIKQLFRAEVIEVAALRKLAERFIQCPESVNWFMYERYTEEAEEMGEEYGFNEQDGEEVHILEGINTVNEEFKILDFMFCDGDIIKAAGMEDQWEE